MKKQNGSVQKQPSWSSEITSSYSQTIAFRDEARSKMKLEKQILQKVSGFIGTYVAISWHNTHKNNICQVASIRRLQLRHA